jgi:hypothetical protein
MTINEVQIMTVTTAAITPTALGDKSANGFLNEGGIESIIGGSSGFKVLCIR